MSTCKNCSLPIEVKQGRRPREFCDNNQKCRNEYFRKNKKVATHKTIPIEQWNEIQDKMALAKIKMEKVAPASGRRIDIKFVTPRPPQENAALYNSAHTDSKIIISETTPESFDGERTNYTTQDEHCQWEEPKNPNQELITKYQTELGNLGTSQIAKDRRKWLEKQIVNLKK